MLRRCAWCGTWLGQTDSHDSSKITHGICPTCLVKLQREIRASLATQQHVDDGSPTAEVAGCELTTHS